MEITYEEFLVLVRTKADNSDSDSNSECPVTQTLNLIQGKWVLNILFYLCRTDSARFGEIHKSHPKMSKTMLSSVLKQLERNGLVIRHQFNEIPPHTEYSLTENGKALMPIFYEMFKWRTSRPDGINFSAEYSE